MPALRTRVPIKCNENHGNIFFAQIWYDYKYNQIYKGLLCIAWMFFEKRKLNLVFSLIEINVIKSTIEFQET